MKEYKKLTLFLICVVLIKIAFAFLGNNYEHFSLRDFFASVLNTENIVAVTNKSRKAAGLNVLKIDSKLQFAAQKKADDMLKNQYFSHTGPSGKMAWDFMNDAGYNYLFAGENLAMNFNSAEEVTEGWLASLTHKENILSDKYTQIGIGVATGKFLGADSTIVVQMFGKPLRSGALISSITRSKRHVRLAVRTAGMPIVKGVSIEAAIPAKNLLDILFSYIAACGIGIIIWRFFKEKYYRNKMVGVYALFVIAASLVLANLP